MNLPKLKNHPFSVNALFKKSIVLTFAFPQEQIKSLIPECLTLDTFDNKWAFIAVAMVETEHLRPKAFPKLLGNNFFLIGYRVFVRYTNAKGKNLRGLYILKSETNKRKMAFFGNIFTHYNYTSTDIKVTKNSLETIISSAKSRFSLSYLNRKNNIQLPETSPFKNWKEARRFAGPLPFTFTYNSVKKEVLIIEGVRNNWKPSPIKIQNFKFKYLDELDFKHPQLANAFIVENIPYTWKKGKLELWK
ncbi:hypothetical protein PK35_14005 [Tamlana nanhaiensis]|uniref:DUF2071 domain-containing protein n=1 Tax=Neotamlana nanhaiensis TaxID=1382798 RepID=A0A0D7W0Z3_9FLAO|nr:DUF2071 domain-containing protein [Tamlana nanhaiensis]KJD31522.1 hypothetical protein PK35_14005 [Tamlana nanhaiensis]